MQRGQKSQSRVKHQRSVGRYNSPYQRGGTIFSPMNPWAMTSHKPYGEDAFEATSRKKANRRAKQKGGRVHKVTYPWTTKGRQYKRRRRRR